jgi:hypothetical protein
MVLCAPGWVPSAVRFEFLCQSLAPFLVFENISEQIYALFNFINFYCESENARANNKSFLFDSGYRFG